VCACVCVSVSVCECVCVCAVCDTVHHDHTVSQTKQLFYSSEAEKHYAQRWHNFC